MEWSSVAWEAKKVLGKTNIRFTVRKKVGIFSVLITENGPNKIGNNGNRATAKNVCIFYLGCRQWA